MRRTFVLALLFVAGLLTHYAEVANAAVYKNWRVVSVVVVPPFGIPVCTIENAAGDEVQVVVSLPQAMALSTWIGGIATLEDLNDDGDTLDANENVILGPQ